MKTDRTYAMALDVQEALDRRPDWCATFEDMADESRWVQFVDGVINAAWPFSGAPDARFKKMGSIELTAWSRAKYATGALALTDKTEIAKWIERYFLEVLECDPEFEM